MMESCLLCLDINKDILDCIKADSVRWQELDIANTIEKHFWTLNTIKSSSWVCLSCWRELEDFHKFYLRIEEAHKDFGKIKIEENEVPAQCKKELAIPKMKENEENKNIDNIAYCFLEPEILIDQPLTPEFVEDKETETAKPLYDIDLDDIPLKQVCKRLKLQNNLVNNDPLEKLDKLDVKSKKRKSFKAAAAVNKVITEDSKSMDLHIKQEPKDLNDNDSDSVSDNDNEDSDVNFQPDKNPSSETAKTKTHKTLSKKQQKENDKFIAEHFKQMFCDICQVPFQDFATMQKHFNKIHKRRGYLVCCKRKFSDRSKLVDHLNCHLNPDHFKCRECGKIMAERSTFNNHMLRVHRASEIVKKHCCDVCGKSFTKESVLRIHKLTHLSEEEKKYPCSDCGKNYGSSYILHQHQQAVHLKRFVKICYVCGKAINSSAEFKLHMNKHEGIPLPVISCDVCGLRLTSERGLKLHKESQHPVGGKQEHHCPICPKISPTIKALRKHINTMHKKGYDHKCSFCEKAFKRSEGLREHVASQHTGTALYTCPWCPQTFNSNGNMHSHRKKMHPKEWLESKLQKYSGNIPPEM